MKKIYSHTSMNKFSSYTGMIINCRKEYNIIQHQLYYKKRN